MEGTHRSMRVALSHEVEKLESSLSFLATVVLLALISAFSVLCGVS